MNDDDWPILESILVFRDNVRARLTSLYRDLEDGRQSLTRHIARMLVMTIEHESFHLEVSFTSNAFDMTKGVCEYRLFYIYLCNVRGVVHCHPRVFLPRHGSYLLTTGQISMPHPSQQ